MFNNPIKPDDLVEPSTEQNILAAAERLFLDRGYSLVSTTDIAREAGCNQALIHYYYRTKDRLFEAIFEKKATRFFSVILDFEKRGESFEETVRRIVDIHFRMLLEEPKLPFLLFNELSINPGRIAVIRDRLGGLAEKTLERFQARLSAEIYAGRVRQVSLIDIILNIVSLNVALFLAHPVLVSAFGMTEEEYAILAEKRQKENADFILKGLRP